MKIIYVIFLIAPLIIKLRWDYVAWLAKKHINHPQRWAATAVGMLILSFLVWRIAPIKYLIQPFCLSAAIFCMLFDYLINWLEDRDWWFIPDEYDYDASWTDKNIYAPLGLWWLMIIKGLFLTGSILINPWLWH